MEHIVQFAINIDDDAIRRYIMANATKQIMSNIEKELKDYIIPKYGTGLADSAVNGFFEQNKEEIIERTVKSLSDRIYRRKALKDAVNSIDQEINQ